MSVLGKIQRRLIEALGGSLLGDVGLSSDADLELRGFRQITDRVRTRDLDQLSHEQMVKLSLYLYSSNSMAKWLVNTPVSLAVAREVPYSIEIDIEMALAMGERGAPTTPEEARALALQIRGWLDMFWRHTAHDVQGRADQYAKTFLVTGHLVLPIAQINETSGVPQLDLLDAGQIKGVDPFAGSSMLPGAVRYTPNDGTAQERTVEIIRPNVDGALLPLAPNAQQIRGCLYFANSSLLNSMRGVSYLMDVADWLDALDQGTWTSLDRAKLRNAIIWHLVVEGADTPEKITQEVTKLTTALLNPGNVYGSNERIKLEAKRSQLEAGDTVDLHRLIRNHILGSKSFPEVWFGEGGTVNRSTASEQTDVAYKALLEMQQAFRRIFRTLLHFGYDSIQARQTRLPFRPNAPWLKLEPELPVVQERDISRQAQAVVQLEAALADAVASEFISKKTARTTFLGLVAKIAGETIELDMEEQRIQAEATERQEAEQERANAMARAALDAAADRPPQDGQGAAPAGGNGNEPGRAVEAMMPSLSAEMTPLGLVLSPSKPQEPPVINVDVPAPIVNITTPEPQVHVTVEAPKPTVIFADPPQVTVQAPTVNLSPIIQPAKVDVTLKTPPQKGLKIERDRTGRITGAKPEEE